MLAHCWLTGRTQIHKVERWSKLHSLPLRVKVHLKAKMFGETTGATLVDILNRQTLKPKSAVMRGEILRTLDLEHMFQLDRVGATLCRGQPQALLAQRLPRSHLANPAYRARVASGWGILPRWLSVREQHFPMLSRIQGAVMSATLHLHLHFCAAVPTWMLIASVVVIWVAVGCVATEQYKQACECAEDEVPDLLVDVDDAGCTLGKSCGGCSKMMPGRDYSRHGHSNTGPRKAIGKKDAHWHPPQPSWMEGEIVAFSAAGLVGIGILYGRRRALNNDVRTHQGRKYGRIGRDESRP